MSERYTNERYGNWIPIDNNPSIEDTYLVAWLPQSLDREECFVALLNYDSVNGWDFDDLEKKTSKYWAGVELELHAWMPLPDMYKII